MRRRRAAHRCSRSPPAPRRCSASRRSASPSLPIVTLALAHPALAGRAPTRARRGVARLRVRLRRSSAPACRGSTSRSTRSAACRCRSRRSAPPGFCAFLALYPAAAGWLATRWTAPRSWQRALAAAGGVDARRMAAQRRSSPAFGWLSLGYAQLPDGGRAPLAGYAPIGGVFAVSLAVALVARARSRSRSTRSRVGARGAASRCSPASRSLVGAAARRSAASSGPRRPARRSPCRCVQGNVAQDLKFDPGFPRARRSTSTPSSSARSRGRLDRAAGERVPGVRRRSARTRCCSRCSRTAARTRRRHAASACSRSSRRCPAATSRATTTASSALGTARAAALPQAPSRAVRRDDSARSPSSAGSSARCWRSRSRARRRATPTRRRSRSPASAWPSTSATRTRSAPTSGRRRATATLLVNVTNDAWYGHSLAAEQHNQIAAMRALETGRPLLRATNTGITSAIDHDGREIARLPWFTRGILEVEVTGRQGVTPYVRFGDAPVALARGARARDRRVVGRAADRATALGRAWLSRNRRSSRRRLVLGDRAASRPRASLAHRRSSVSR